MQRPEQLFEVSGDITMTQPPSTNEGNQHSNRVDNSKCNYSEQPPDVTVSQTSLSRQEGVDILKSPAVDNSVVKCDIYVCEQNKTTPSSFPLSETSGHVLVTSCSSPGALSRFSRQGSDPWVPRSEPVSCQQHKERAQSPDSGRSICRSSVSPQRDFGSGLVFRSNSCSSLDDCLESQGAASFSKCSCSATINVLGSPQTVRQNMDVSPRHSREDTKAHEEQGGVLFPKTDMTAETDKDPCSFCVENLKHDLDTTSVKSALKGATPIRGTCERKSGAFVAANLGSSPQGDGYIPKYVTPNMKRFNACRSSSFSDATQHAVKCPLNASLSSPCSTTSTDSLVDSLRNAVGNIRSRLTRRQATGNSRIQRARSASAIDRISQRSPPRDMPGTKDKGRRRQNKLVQQLKRTYSERDRKRNRFGGSAIISPAAERKRLDTSKELMSLLKETKQGSPAIGARYATARPCSLSNYTLPHRMQPTYRHLTDNTSVSNDSDAETPKPDTTLPSQPDVAVVATRAMNQTKDNRRLAYDSGCVDTDILCASQRDISGCTADTTIDDFSDETFKQLEIGSRKILDSVDTISNAPSLDSYYERRLAEELEMDATSHDDDAVFRDSAVYSDDGVLLGAGDTPSTADNGADNDNGTTQCINYSTTGDENGTTSKDSVKYVNDAITESDNDTGPSSATVSVNDSTCDISDIAQSKQPVICDTVKSIHEKYNSASNVQAKSRQRRIKKAPAFQEIVRHLEASNNTEQAETPSPEVDVKTAALNLSRELVHCASMARMRQDSGSISDKHFTEEWPPRQRVKSQESDSDMSSMLINEKAVSSVNKMQQSLESVTKTPLSPTPKTEFPWSPTPQTKAPWSPTPVAKKKVGWPWSPTPMPKVTSPSADGPVSPRARVIRSPSPGSKESRVPVVQTPQSLGPVAKEQQPVTSVTNEPMSPVATELPQPASVPYKAKLTVNIHAASTSEETTAFGILHAESPSGDCPGSNEEQPKPPMSPARRGWVRYMVKQLQGDEPAS